MRMTRRLGTMAATMIIVSFVAVGGCATRGEVEALRAEVRDLRSSTETAEARAVRAEVAAQRAAAGAAQNPAVPRPRTASADRAFRENLRK